MRISLLLSALLVGACAGDGGGNNGDWSSSDIRIDGAGAGDESIESLGARMCQAENGNLYVVWYDDREGTNDIWFQASLNEGKSWNGQAVQVNNGDGDASNPDIACIGNTVFVVWEDTRDGELEAKNIYFSKSDSAGTSWLEEDIRLSADPEAKQDSIGPRIASAGDELLVVWSDGINGAYDIYASASSNRGADFEAPVRVDSDDPGSAFSAFPEVAIDESGRAIVVWEDSRNSLNDVYAASSSDSGATFSPDVRLDGGDAPGASDSFGPKVALSDGHAYVVWHDDRSGVNSDIYMNWSSDGGANWLAEAAQVESNGPGASDAELPRLAMSGTTAHVVWQDDRNSAYDIYYRSFVDGAVRPTNQFEGDELTDEEFRLDQGDRPGYSNAINPRIAVEVDTVVVAWEDRRLDGYNYGDPDDVTGTPQGFNNVFYNFSTNGGLFWNSDDDDFIDSFCRGGKWSKNMTVVVDGDIVGAVWEDGRRGNSDIMFGSTELGTSNRHRPDDECGPDAQTAEE